MTEFIVDGFTFCLQEGNDRIYVFKGDAFVNAYFYPSYEAAKEDFDIAKTKKRVVFNKGEGDAHMISLQARLELCDNCYGALPKEWLHKRERACAKRG